MRRVHERPELLTDVFERFPDGIAVAAPSGAIMAWNRALAEMAGADEPAAGVRCCELFGCHLPGGTLEGRCITETAVAARPRPTELRLDLPGSGRSVSVLAVPLDANASRVLFHVRSAGDVSSRAADAPPRLRIYTLGRTRVETAHQSLTGGWLEQRAGQLLKLLICERHRVVATDEIAEALWPNPRTAAANTVRQLVHALRERLEPGRQRHAPARVVVARRGGYTLDLDGVWIDADEFESETTRGMAALADGRRSLAAERFERALALYRGDFLADDPYATWALDERERLRTLVEGPLRVLSDLHADDPAAAAGYLERLAQLEPFDNEVHRQLLALWVRQGRLSRAARRYRAFELRLFAEFGTQPSFELADLLAESDRSAQAWEAAPPRQ
ncbi:MAG TPA: BTAD domain-containing putative transcriptional regulator [Conexibacter sp.]